MMREGLYQIATEYPNAKLAPLKGHPLAKVIRAEDNIGKTGQRRMALT